MIGRRLPDAPIGGNPYSDDWLPGDYWKVLTRVHSSIDDPARPLNVHTLEDQQWWNNTGTYDTRYDQNLTGTVWGVIDPLGNYGMLSIHTVREEEDGTISVRPGDGSSNSILISSSTPDGLPQWHGYIEHGVWKEV